MLSDIWRGLVALADWRGWLRIATGRPEVDVVFITNLRDEADRRRFFGRRAPVPGHANGPRMHLDGVAGRVRGIYVTAAEMMTKDGRRDARDRFIAACQWAEARGARTVLLAASTKRLFGRDGRALKEMFPNLVFTIGDNGTSSLLARDVRAALTRADLAPGRARVMVICPYGILGTMITRRLVDDGFEVVGYGANPAALAETASGFGIATTTDLDRVGRVDAVIACTHNDASKLTAEGIAMLRRPGRRLLVVDVAEPANLDQAVYEREKAVVVRQDAGNGHARRLRYVLGAFSWRKLTLSRGVVFGCFAEAMTLHHAIHRQGRTELAARDWFVIDDANLAEVETLMTGIGFEPPAPRCFGRPVESFRLAIKEADELPSSASPTRPVSVS
jgi:predicted amino acid dehydrogenase